MGVRLGMGTCLASFPWSCWLYYTSSKLLEPSEGLRFPSGWVWHRVLIFALSTDLFISQVSSLKKSHRQQLDAIDTKLHDVLGRKDAAIADLRGELSEVYTKLQKFEALLFNAGLQ